MDIKHPEITVQLSGEDGNAFAIIGRVRHALRRAGLPGAEINEFTDEATSASSYDNLLRICMTWVDCK